MSESISIVQKIIEEAAKSETNEKFESQIEIIDLLSDDKNKVKLKKVIDTKIAVFSEDAIDDATKNKSEKILSKEFFEKVKNFDDKSLASEYDQTVT